MALENKLQEIIHKLEVGGWVPWIKATLVACVVATLFSIVIFDLREWYSFCGLSHEKGMDQAQIARNLADGKGFTTNFIRPAALAQFQENQGAYPKATEFPDTYHAPLNPAVNAVIIKTFDALNNFFKSQTGWVKNFAFDRQVGRDTIVYGFDRIIAAFSLLFFIASLPVWYLTFRRLFDSTLATMSTFLLIGCSRFWQYGETGLPQNLMLLIFAVAVYSLVRATQNQIEGKSETLWIAVVAGCFGLLALANAITIWLFVGVLVYAALAFPARARVLGILIGIFLLMYTPWLVRNYQVSGDPFGISYYSGLTGLRGDEVDIMRSQNLKFGVSPTNFRAKLQKGIVGQFGDMYALLGSVIVAPVFFLALLHAFKRPETSRIRWATFSMWALGAFGMAALGFNDLNSVFQANDLYFLLIPLATAYGLAFVLVLWSRLDIQVKLFRRGFIVLIFALSLLPMFNMLLERRSKIQWPPYYPASIGLLSQWTNTEEIIMSDMPWAVGWYANRASLWLPTTVDEFLELNDYSKLGGNVVALYLTPVSGNKQFLSQIVKGAYREWAPFITRQAMVKDFPLKAVTPLPLEGECVIYADRERWRNVEE